MFSELRKKAENIAQKNKVILLSFKEGTIENTDSSFSKPVPNLVDYAQAAIAVLKEKQKNIQINIKAIIKKAINASCEYDQYMIIGDKSKKDNFPSSTLRPETPRPRIRY